MAKFTRGMKFNKNINPQYVKPQGGFIGLGADTAALYEAERVRDSAINRAAEALGRVLEHDRKKQYWTHTVPEALYAVLDSYDSHAAKLAAIAFLEKHGFKIE